VCLASHIGIKIDNGKGGIAITGGDRATLTSAGQYIENNEVHHVDRLKKTYNDLISIGGVGTKGLFNEMYNAAHEAMTFDKPPYTKYPHLAEYLTDEPA